ncbi:hypothetical protein D3C87_318240 [compost metagenome]
MYREPLRQVTANKGAGGTDGMQTDELPDYLNANWQTLRSDILEGNYRPHAVRKVEISKSDGGRRMLGIPTVIDRLIQQSISQWLSPFFNCRSMYLLINCWLICPLIQVKPNRRI